MLFLLSVFVLSAENFLITIFYFEFSYFSWQFAGPDWSLLQTGFGPLALCLTARIYIIMHVLEQQNQIPVNMRVVMIMTEACEVCSAALGHLYYCSSVLHGGVHAARWVLQGQACMHCVHTEQC